MKERVKLNTSLTWIVYICFKIAIKLVKIFAENISSTKLAYWKYKFIRCIIIIFFCKYVKYENEVWTSKRKIQAEEKKGEREKVWSKL